MSVHAADGTTGGDGSGEWWASVWSSAIGQAFNESRELEAGRRLARRSAFGANAGLEGPEVAPGSMLLRDPGGEWTAQLGIQQLDDGRWETILRTVAADPQLTAAVVTGDLPVGLHGRAVALGCSLAPERRDLGADCTCPDWHEPCRHVGALVALVSEMIVDDPWLLAMLRGRTRDQIVEAVRSVRAGRLGIDIGEPGVRGVDAGVAATAAFRRESQPIPTPLPGVRRPASPVSFRPPPLDAGVKMDDLERLVSEAAEQAFRLLSQDVSPRRPQDP